jgi:hypothetical protein
VSDMVKVALILGIAAVICTALLLYFGSFWTCVRSGYIPSYCASR